MLINGTEGSYPGGPCQIITAWLAGNPIAGNNMVQTVPAGKLWKIFALSLSFTTAVAVANRIFTYQILMPGKVMWQSTSASVQVASLTWTYQMGPIGYPNAATVDTSLVMWMNAPVLILLGGGSITTSITNIQAADQVSQSNLGLYIEEYQLA